MKQPVRFWLVFVFCIGVLFVSAQEYKVLSFETMPTDMAARVNSRVGANGRKCALLKVYVQDKISHANGAVVDDIVTKGMEKWIYMAHDSKQVEFVFENHLPLHIRFDDYQVPVLTEQTVYVVKLVDENSGSGQSGNVLAENPVSQTESILKDAIGAYNDGYYDKAMSLFLKISDDKTAAYWLGVMYYNGYGVAQDYNEAFRWLSKSAKQGNAWGQNKLGDMYNRGEGVVSDYSEAVRWYRKSAEQGNAYGQYLLGVMYGNGIGVEKDYSEAVKWYRKSAEQGTDRAQYKLGLMYENGDGVTRDINEAIKWYRKSAEHNYGKAIKALKRLNEE